MISFQKKYHTKGFTLIELVIVLVLLSIISVGMTSYIATGVEIYKVKALQSKTLSSLRFAMARLEREVSTAKVDSFKVNDNCLEFTPAIDPIKPCEIERSCSPELFKKTFSILNDKPKIASLNENNEKVQYCFIDRQLMRNNIQMTDKNLGGEFMILSKKSILKTLFKVELDGKEIGFVQSIDIGPIYIGVK